MPTGTVKALAGLDWRSFSARYFPRRRRHDSEPLAAYEAYRNGQSAQANNAAFAEAAVDAWEAEGGSAQ
jgi:hypothetical protein